MDITYLLFLQNFRESTNNILTPLISFITTFGEPPTIYALLAITYWCVNKHVGTLMLMTFSLASFTNQLLKVTLTVYRPWVRSPLIEPVPSAKITATGYSFPSGHVANSTSIYGSIAFSLQGRKNIEFLLGFLILAVMFSRNYLGVHTPQDVLVSLVITVPLLFVSDWLLKWVTVGENRDWLVMLIGMVLGITLAIYAVVKSYPLDYIDGKLLVDPKVMIIDTFYCAGTMTGFWLAWFIDRRFIQYQPTFKSKMQRLGVGVCGFFLLIPLLFLLPRELSKILGSKLAGAFSSTFLIMIIIVVIYPWLVNLVLHKKSYKIIKLKILLLAYEKLI